MFRQQVMPTMDFSTADQAEIYLRSVLYALDMGIAVGLVAAVFGHLIGSCMATFYYGDLPLPIPEAEETAYTRGEVIQFGAKVALGVGAAAAICSFFPAVQSAVNNGFANGPDAVNPLEPLYALWRIL